MSSLELCLYKPELSIEEFMDLKNTEPEYWRLYVDYCMVDCISLSHIWKKFVESTNTLIVRMGPQYLRKCNASSCNTVGSLGMKLVKVLNKYESWAYLSWSKGVRVAGQLRAAAVGASLSLYVVLFS